MTEELKNKIEILKKSRSEEDRKLCIPLLKDYLATHPNDATSWYDLACCFDFCGFEKEAAPCYQETYEIGWEQLPESEQTSFFVGFGSTLRNNLDFARSEKILREAISHFPKFPALKVFLAFTLYSMGRFQESSQLLFQSTIEMPDKSFDGYEKAIQWYVENLETHALFTDAK